MREGEVFRRAITSARDAIENTGRDKGWDLKLRFHYGVDEWREFMERHDEHAPFISTAFDPAINPQLDASNSGCLIVYDGKGLDNPVAGTAVRTYRWKLRHLIEHGGLWLPDEDILLGEGSPGFDASILPPECPLDARVSQRGGLYVSPGYEGHKLGSWLSWACNSMAFQICDYDWTVALKKEAGDPFTKHCGYLGKARIGTPLLKFWLVWESRGEMLLRLRLDEVIGGDNLAPVVKYRPQ